MSEEKQWSLYEKPPFREAGIKGAPQSGGGLRKFHKPPVCCRTLSPFQKGAFWQKRQHSPVNIFYAVTLKLYYFTESGFNALPLGGGVFYYYVFKAGFTGSSQAYCKLSLALHKSKL